MVSENRYRNEQSELTASGNPVAVELPISEHVCMFYEQPAEQAPVVVPYLKLGLELGERVIYVADDASFGEVRRWLARAGVDVPAFESRGAFLLWGRDQWRPAAGINADAMACRLREIVNGAREDGFEAVRICAEMTWTLEPDLPAADVAHWEATLNEFAAEAPVRVMCQYSRSRLSPALVESAFRTHSLAYVGDERYPNHYYEPLSIIQEGSAETRTDWKLRQLCKMKRATHDREEEIRTSVEETEDARNRAHYDDLYRLVGDTSERLRIANAAKDDFLALVSHELRTPLTMILGNAEILERCGDGLDEATRVAALADLRQEAERLSSLVEHLLIISRMESGDIIETEPVLPVRVIESIAGRYQERTIEIDGDSALAIWGNANSMRDVFENLLSNAHKYSPLERPINVEVSREGDDCVVAVHDRGIGLPDEERIHLFEPFYRAPRVAATQVRGLGIGLTVCQRIIEAHKGHIWAEARSGGGTSFFVRLPAVTFFD